MIFTAKFKGHCYFFIGETLRKGLSYGRPPITQDSSFLKVIHHKVLVKYAYSCPEPFWAIRLTWRSRRPAQCLLWLRWNGPQSFIFMALLYKIKGACSSLSAHLSCSLILLTSIKQVQDTCDLGAKIFIFIYQPPENMLIEVQYNYQSINSPANFLF